MQKLFFKEEQYFSNFWFWVFLIFVFTASLAPAVVTIYNQAVLGKAEGETPNSTVSLLIILAILVLVYTGVILLFRKMKLVTEVRSDGFYYRYPPFILKKRGFLKGEIKQFEIRNYQPIREYGGWGIRHGWGKSGSAFNVKGKTGLQLYLLDGKKVLFGTQRGDALLRAMNKMMKGE